MYPIPWPLLFFFLFHCFILCATSISWNKNVFFNLILPRWYKKANTNKKNSNCKISKLNKCSIKNNFSLIKIFPLILLSHHHKLKDFMERQKKKNKTICSCLFHKKQFVREINNLRADYISFYEFFAFSLLFNFFFLFFFVRQGLSFLSWKSKSFCLHWISIYAPVMSHSFIVNAMWWNHVCGCKWVRICICCSYTHTHTLVRIY